MSVSKADPPAPARPAKPSARGRSARERILSAAVRRIAREGIDGVRIARIAMDAGVSSSLVHYHFATREVLLGEALEYSYERAGDVRIGAGDVGIGSGDVRIGAGDVRIGAGGPPVASHIERLRSMIDQCLPTTPGLEEDWVLWVELWLRAVRHPELRPVAENLYRRMREWFAAEIAAGVRDGEFAACEAGEVADRLLALIDGFGIRTLLGDSSVPLSRARETLWAALDRELAAPARSDP